MVIVTKTTVGIEIAMPTIRSGNRRTSLKIRRSPKIDKRLSPVVESIISCSNFQALQESERRGGARQISSQQSTGRSAFRQGLTGHFHGFVHLDALLAMVVAIEDRNTARLPLPDSPKRRRGSNV